jgi:hypothetical protein
VPFGSSDRVVVTQPDAPSADRFVTSTNTCAPDCAQGRYLRELWRYSGTQKQFTVAERAMCQAIDPTHWQCDPANPTLARGEPIGPPR